MAVRAENTRRRAASNSTTPRSEIRGAQDGSTRQPGDAYENLALLAATVHGDALTPAPMTTGGYTPTTSYPCERRCATTFARPRARASAKVSGLMLWTSAYSAVCRVPGM